MGQRIALDRASRRNRQPKDDCCLSTDALWRWVGLTSVIWEMISRSRLSNELCLIAGEARVRIPFPFRLVRALKVNGSAAEGGERRPSVGAARLMQTVD